MSIILKGGASSNLADINSDNELKVALTSNPDSSGFVSVVAQQDGGAIIGTPESLPIDGTEDYQLRISTDDLVDFEVFNYAAQNTAKFIYRNTTMTNAWGSGFITTNSGNITTINTGTLTNSYKPIKMIGNNASYCEIKLSFTGTWGATNTNLDFGFFIAAITTPFAPTDGVYFRVNNTGIFAVTNNNGSEQTSSPFVTSSTNSTPWSPTLGTTYKFTITSTERNAKFWINDVLYAELLVPSGVGQITSTNAFSFSMRQAIGGTAASAVLNAKLASYHIYQGAISLFTPYEVKMTKSLGSYEGLAGGTMGGLSKYTNNTNATAAVPTNTTAALGTGLGGEFWETDTLAVNTDGIITSYQNPVGGVAQIPRNLIISGIKIDSYVQTIQVGGGYNAVWTLAFGHTAVSLATAEAATTKNPRKILIGNQAVPATSAALVALSTVTYFFKSPIVVAPGEFIQLCKKKVGTAPSSGVIAHSVLLDYYYE